MGDISSLVISHLGDYGTHMSNSGAAQQLATRIEAARTQAGMDYRQLSHESGIAYSTLRRKIQVNPDSLTVKETASLALALGAHFETFFVRTK